MAREGWPQKGKDSANNEGGKDGEVKTVRPGRRGKDDEAGWRGEDGESLEPDHLSWITGQVVLTVRFCDKNVGAHFKVLH